MDENKIAKILEHYSPEAQTVKAIEEFAELQVELAKLLNKQGDVFDLFREMADAFIMLVQMMSIYDIDPKKLDKEIAYKLDRQLRRIEEEKNERD